MARKRPSRATQDDLSAKIDAEITAIGSVLAARAIGAAAVARFKRPDPTVQSAPKPKWTPKRRYLEKPAKLSSKRERIAAAFKEYLGPEKWVSGTDQPGIAKEIAHRAGVSEQAVTACLRDKKFRDAYLRPMANRLLNRLARKTT